VTKSKSPAGGLLLPTLIMLIAVGVLAWAVSAAGGGNASSSHTQQEAKNPNDQAKVDIEPRRDADDPMARGDVDAPVVLIDYSDFQCPFCGKFARDIAPEIVDKYVEEGIVRIEWRDFPYLGDDSWKGAKAGRAAAAQGKFWQFHDAIYADQPKTNSGQMTDKFLKGIAKDAGMDVKKFTADLKSDKYMEAIEKDFEEGQSIGVSAAPTFFINGIPIMGAQPLSAFGDVIDKQAEDAE